MTCTSERRLFLMRDPININDGFFFGFLFSSRARRRASKGCA